MVSGREVESGMVGEIIDVIEERIRFPWRHGAVKFPIGKWVPMIMLPSMLWLATLHPYLVVFTFLLLLPAVFLIAVRTVIKHRPQTQFFLFWSYTSTAYLLYVYEVKCVGLFWDLPKIISWWENLVLVAGAAVSLWLYRKMRETRKRRNSEGRMCRICQQQVVGKDHHCVWLDMCIGSSNKRIFLLFLTSTSMTATHLALLLTSAACPGQLIGPVLLPELCWPDKENDRLLLVVGLYSGLVAGLLALLLGEQVTRSIRRRAGVGAPLELWVTSPRPPTLPSPPPTPI
eukprot:TRINITY_DN24181_c0_g1_i1.p1 TRINITY_DN24181_c0_g1~~TRINITY_DN24181_c0_g1_i1.p1  ORF type:complete len:306 (-),score=73.79 TRINITY_DN24181_c0_g1_i1:111-971(-)